MYNKQVTLAVIGFWRWPPPRPSDCYYCAAAHSEADCFNPCKSTEVKLKTLFLALTFVRNYWQYDTNTFSQKNLTCRNIFFYKQVFSKSSATQTTTQLVPDFGNRHFFNSDRFPAGLRSSFCPQHWSQNSRTYSEFLIKWKNFLPFSPLTYLTWI